MIRGLAGTMVRRALLTALVRSGPQRALPNHLPPKLLKCPDASVPVAVILAISSDAQSLAIERSSEALAQLEATGTPESEHLCISGVK